MSFDPVHPSEDFLRSIDIHTLLPQQEPFVMIDRMVYFDEKTVVTETTVREDNLFTDNGLFSEYGLIENIAQTCAARIGYTNVYILKKGVQVGFIGSVKRLVLIRRPAVGSVLKTCVEVREEVFGVTLAKAVVSVGGEEIVTCDIKIAIQEEAA